MNESSKTKKWIQKDLIGKYKSESKKSWADQVDEAGDQDFFDLSPTNTSTNTIDEIDKLDMCGILDASESINSTSFLAQVPNDFRCTEKWFSKRSLQIQDIRQRLQMSYEQKMQQEQQWNNYWYVLCDWYTYQYKSWEQDWNNYQQKLCLDEQNIMREQEKDENNITKMIE